MNSFYIFTYGCQMNKSDSERIETFLQEKLGLKKAKTPEGADLLVFNMCSVRQSAVDRIWGKINWLKKLKKKPKTVLTGCILKEDFEKFKQHFDYILPIKKLPLWKKYLEKEKFHLWQDNRECPEIEYFKIKPSFSKFSAYIPISTGCNNFCAYCVVPFTRGKEIHRDPEEILNETKEALKSGAKEIWLLGQNVNSYQGRLDGKRIDFADLLTLINKIEGKFWIRFTSPHPKDFSDKLIKAMKECDKVTPYLNLPLQSGDDEILRKMNRNYTVSEYKALVKKIRKMIPDITLSTDIIVGFPGEKEKHFLNTVKLFKEIKFDMAYIARYSPRPGTLAYKKYKDDVPEEEKKRREKILTEILKKIALERNKRFVGRKVEVLVEKKRKDYLFGKSFHYKTVKFKGDESLIGNFVFVKIKKALSLGLEGEVTF